MFCQFYSSIGGNIYKARKITLYFRINKRFKENVTMRADTKGYQLIYEEVKAVKLFLITFYLIFYTYDFYY